MTTAKEATLARLERLLALDKQPKPRLPKGSVRG